jgi:hypothetical protein
VDDVPGSEVSARYLHFLRSGEARALLGVVEHNAWDVVAMTALVGLYGEPMVETPDGVEWGTQLDVRDVVGVARTVQRARAGGEAWNAIQHAVERGGGGESLRARAEIAKARGDRARALADFEQLAKDVDDASVRLQLARLYEHFARDHAQALAMVERGTAESDAARAKRRARLEAKAARVSSAQRELLPGVSSARRARRSSPRR